MAIVLDTSTNGSQGGGNQTFTHTCTGKNLILFVGVRTQSGDIVTGVTYNSVSMTQLSKVNINTAYLYIYYLLAPSTGSNTVAINVSDQSKNVQGISVSYTGVKQSGQPDSSNTNTATSNTITTSTTVIANGCWLISAFSHADGSSGTLSAGTGVTQRCLNNDIRIGDSNGVVPTGSQSMTWNSTATENLAMVMASFTPLPGGGFFALVK